MSVVFLVSVNSYCYTVRRKTLFKRCSQRHEEAGHQTLGFVGFYRLLARERERERERDRDREGEGERESLERERE